MLGRCVGEHREDHAGRTTGLNAALRAMFSVQTAAAIQAHAIRRRTYKTLCSLSRGSEEFGFAVLRSTRFAPNSARAIRSGFA